ncbi:DUF2087 domain-containing protein [Deinococcus cellulosilyticus]|uniref:HTH arsR-type domain-containing protein n=1 Tax=Deinococcus cellulosilyticus (strain DSM 18568 / NBRC 106333 / KACC 11606 / 5516J-15) TaxID=1223518 RepID=A0A511NAU9_DEIC1|nr:metalloregulator ArsR/SmtB family transcription factor [Deinococcus cellulosilyticus]GEM49933.1 hypothetical protein DC3_55680 [Deinococcus cellulosilyticus NBRC 106333 = KACC 11606]
MTLTPEQILDLCKALSDGNRLRILGLLAQQPLAVEKIAEALQVGVSTTSHHLSRLSKAGLVHAAAQGHYSIYSVRQETLTALGALLSDPARLAGLSEVQAAGDKFASKVLQVFLDEEGRIKAFPMQHKKMMVLLNHVLQVFESGQSYTEKEVNDLLLRFHDDTATLRRNLVEHGLMHREGGGGRYWRASDLPADEEA